VQRLGSPVVDLLLFAPEAGFLVLLGLGLFTRGRAGAGSKEVLVPAPLSLLNTTGVLTISTAQHSTAQHSTAQHSTAQYDMSQIHWVQGPIRVGH